MKQDFWTAFGQYMSPILSADQEKVNWVNYKTGLKHIRFSMQAEKAESSIGIVITAPDSLTRDLYYDQFLQLKKLLENETSEPWDWLAHTEDEWGKPIATIRKVLQGTSIYKRDDWPELISFFKPRIIALDAFWSNVKYGFDPL